MTSTNPQFTQAFVFLLCLFSSPPKPMKHIFLPPSPQIHRVDSKGGDEPSDGGVNWTHLCAFFVFFSLMSADASESVAGVAAAPSTAAGNRLSPIPTDAAAVAGRHRVWRKLPKSSYRGRMQIIRLCKSTTVLKRTPFLLISQTSKSVKFLPAPSPPSSRPTGTSFDLLPAQISIRSGKHVPAAATIVVLEVTAAHSSRTVMVSSPML